MAMECAILGNFNLIIFTSLLMHLCLGIGLYVQEIRRSIEHEEDNPDSNAAPWFSSSLLDVTFLERLLNQTFTPFTDAKEQSLEDEPDVNLPER